MTTGSVWAWALKVNYTGEGYKPEHISSICVPLKKFGSRWGHDHRITSTPEHNGKGNYASRSGTAGAAARLFKSPLILQKRVNGDDKRMIWFFLAGWISGAVFMVLYARWWVHKHTKIVKMPPLNEENEESKSHE